MVSRIVAVLLILTGAVWIVQGFGIAPTGSFMDGRPIWGILGLGCLAVGFGGLAFDRYRRARR